MAYRAVQIRDIATSQNGRIDVLYTEGFVPIPAGAGAGESFENAAALKAEITAIQASLPAKTLMLMALAQYWLKPDGSFNNINQVTNKQLQWDPTAPTPWRTV